MEYPEWMENLQTDMDTWNRSVMRLPPLPHPSPTPLGGPALHTQASVSSLGQLLNQFASPEQSFGSPAYSNQPSEGSFLGQLLGSGSGTLEPDLPSPALTVLLDKLGSGYGILQPDPIQPFYTKHLWSSMTTA